MPTDYRHTDKHLGLVMTTLFSEFMTKFICDTYTNDRVLTWCRQTQPVVTEDRLDGNWLWTHTSPRQLTNPGLIKQMSWPSDFLLLWITLDLIWTYWLPYGLCLWNKARGLGQGWTRPAGRAPGRPGVFSERDIGNTSLCVALPEQANSHSSDASYHG